MKQNKTMSIMFLGMFVFYVILLISALFLRVEMESTSVNLIPFKSIAEGISYQFVDVQVWGNVVLFIPLGIYLMILGKKSSVPKALLTIFLSSLGIEVIQYVFRIGASDVDDLLLNCLGGILGILIYWVLEKWLKTKEKVKRTVTVMSFCVGVPLLIITVLLFYVNYVNQ